MIPVGCEQPIILCLLHFLRDKIVQNIRTSFFFMTWVDFWNHLDCQVASLKNLGEKMLNNPPILSVLRHSRCHAHFSRFLKWLRSLSCNLWNSPAEVTAERTSCYIGNRWYLMTNSWRKNIKLVRIKALQSRPRNLTATGTFPSRQRASKPIAIPGLFHMHWSWCCNLQGSNGNLPFDSLKWKTFAANGVWCLLSFMPYLCYCKHLEC